jgi:hypothetical protein
MAYYAPFVKQATVIELKSVPIEGATVLVPAPSDYLSSDRVTLKIDDILVVERQLVEAPVGNFLSVLLPKDKLLQHLGSGKKFSYIYYHRGLNAISSEVRVFDIRP